MCKIEGCNVDYRLVRGLCATHYSAAKYRGEFGGKRCSKPGCQGIVAAYGVCPTHYYQMRREGGIEGKNVLCSFPQCTKYSITRGFCSGHYEQWRQKGELQMSPLNIVGEWGPWRTNTKGYIERTRWLEKGKKEHQKQHRYVLEQHIGRELERHEEVHHLNGDRGDNRIENLEIWSTKQPKGQRIEDKVEFAKEILALYEPNALK